MPLRQDTPNQINVLTTWWWNDISILGRYGTVRAFPTIVSLQQSQVWAKEAAAAANKVAEGDIDSNSGSNIDSNIDSDIDSEDDKDKIEEIDGTERNIVPWMLSDKRFHKILLDYLTGNTAMY